MRVFTEPWPWYVAGPIIGLFVPLLLLLGNRQFGVSGGLRSLCAAVLPARSEFLRFDWKKVGAWNLAFVAGIALGGGIAAHLVGLTTPDIAVDTKEAIASLGIHQITGLSPSAIFSWSALLTVRGFVCTVIGGSLVGFGTAYAGGCTSGHGITGLASFQLPSLIAVAAMFVGGVLTSFFILPLLF